MNGRLIHIGSDHGGFKLKEILIDFLKEKEYEINDLGTFSEQSVDYPEFGRKVGYAVLKDGYFGIIICGTGIGISISANRLMGIRAALCHNIEYAKLAREHNDANILALGGRFLDELKAKAITEMFLTTNFEGGRHQKRVECIDKI
ncbi:MAG: ribose 5-phosphate isomerase B [Candidatus Delongbacteria bacterium]|nr:ribose 5-phosphate isomerase B [Candidatus Delongbacteria bacterium]MCG2761221.1 ribose 5-phosphate isomerase B [Candidatus Delongbacteria bacterium]